MNALQPGQHTNPGKTPSREDTRRAFAALSCHSIYGAPAPARQGQKPRKHKQHAHPLRDEHGAFTLVGKAGSMDRYDEHGGYLGTESWPRRKWLGGLSAQRGY